MKSNLSPVFWREVKSLFWSPIAYIVLGAYTLICSYFWGSIVTNYSSYSMQMLSRGGQGEMKLMDYMFAPFWGNIMVTFIFLLPLVSMRAFSEEKKSGTIEMLFTLPLTDLDIVLGKYLAQLAFAAIMLLISLAYPLSILGLAHPHWPTVATGTLGLGLVMASFLALGTLASSLSENQVVSAALGFGALLLLFIMDWVAKSGGGTLQAILSELSVLGHYEPMGRGLVNLKDFTYFAFFIGFCLFGTLRVLESKKWR
jgi:ABC-2 type transport system permease protein